MIKLWIIWNLALIFSVTSDSLLPENKTMVDIKLFTNSGSSCGGRDVFTKVCNKVNSECCEEEIIADNALAFQVGSTVSSTIRKCSNFQVASYEKKLTVSLSNYQQMGVEMKLANITMETNDGVSCGGWFVFAKICNIDSGKCCEEEIINNGNSGFDGGDTIVRRFQGSCYNLLLTYDDSITIKLTSWEELTKESIESFCPKHVKIGLSMGNVGLVYDYPKKRIKETPTYTLKFEKEKSMEDFCPHHIEIGLSKGDEMLMAYFMEPSVPTSITPTIDLEYILTERDWTRYQIKHMEEIMTRKMEQRITNLSHEMDKQLQKITNAIPTNCYTYSNGSTCSIN